MINLRLISVLFLMSSAMINLSYADVYKWKDSEGKLRYSDVPPRSDTKYEVLNKKKELSAGNAKITLVEPEKKAEPEKKQDKQNLNADKLKALTAQQAKENLAIDTENCQAAKSNLATYQNGGRIKRVNEKGEVQFLSDADIANAKQIAQKDVEKYCNTSLNLVGR